MREQIKCLQSAGTNETSQNNTSNNLNYISRPFNQTFDFLEAVEAKRSEFKKIFSSLDSRASYPALFSILWYSTLPCYDVKDVTSSFVWEKSLIKHCTWKGELVPCSAIFTKFPTDQGLCCSFNMKAADSIFTGRMYPKLLKDLQNNDSSAAFINSTLPKWYTDANEPSTQTGINKGLSFMLDAHTDLLSASSIDRDFKGFTGLISYKGSFPLVYQRGFQIRPGHNNLISIGATMIEASQNLRSIEPWRRKCLFHDETQNLTIYKEYTQSNCFLECSLKYAQEHVLNKNNESCNPWFFPIIKTSPFLCDPWETVEFLSATHNTPDSRCDYCLPSCSSTLYQPTISTLPFRRCDDTNLGVSPLCNLDDQTLPDPKLWGQELKTEYGHHPPPFIASLKTSQRKYLSTIQVSFFTNNYGRLFHSIMY